ncbi:MAG: hypothetical protein R2749_31155 [Acidimicrobiales bacterium]
MRVFERFTTVAGLSGGRARSSSGGARSPSSSRCSATTWRTTSGCSTRSWRCSPQLATRRPVTWSGTVRAPLTDQRVHPALEAAPLPTWVGVGGSQHSVVRTAQYGLPMMLAIIGGSPLAFAPFVELYQRPLPSNARRTGGRPPPRPRGRHRQTARERCTGPLRGHARPHRRRSGWGPMTRTQFEAAAGPDNALMVRCAGDGGGEDRPGRSRSSACPAST